MKIINSLRFIACNLIFAQVGQKIDIVKPPENEDSNSYIDLKNRIDPSLAEPMVFIEKRGVIPPSYYKKRFK